MDKAFKNMDERFKNIENELNYNYNSNLWKNVEGMLGDNALDQAFVNAAQAATANSTIDYGNIDDAFLDDAFVEAVKHTKADYQSAYFKEFKSVEQDILFNDSFVSAAAVSSAIYSPEYWNDANLALQAEGLHHEYKSDYWREAEKLLLKGERKVFFLRWGAVATILLLLSFFGLKVNQQIGHEQFAEKSVKSTPVQIDNSNEIAEHNLDGNQNIILDHTTPNNTQSEIKNFETENNIDYTGTNFSNKNVDDKNKVNNDISQNTSNLQDKTHQTLTQDDNNTSPDITLKIQDETRSTDGEGLDELESLGFKIDKKESIEKMNRDLSILLTETDQIEKINLSKIDYTPLFSVHQFAIKVEKGLGNSFGASKNVITPRNALYLDYRFNPAYKLRNVQFGVDLGLYHMNLDNFEYENNYSIYSIQGSVDHYWYRMTYKDLIYLSTKFNTYFNIGRKSKFRVGLGIDRLMTSRIKMEYKEELSEYAIDEGDVWGLNDGINTLDLNFGIGYEFKLNSKFSFLIDSRVGLGDKTNNDYLKIKRTDRDVSVQLGIKYNIFATH